MEKTVNFDLTGKVAIVTGGSRGLGVELATSMAEYGADIALMAGNVEKMKKVAADITEKTGRKVIWVKVNIGDEESVKAAVQTVMDEYGKIDILVNNFGTSNPQKDLDIKNTEYDEYIRTVDINLASVFMTSQAAIPHMAANGGGSIINISSIGGLRPDISQIAYGTSKAAINYLTKLIATQCARDNIRCNAVLPGMTATEAVSNNLTPEFQEFFLKHIPIKRMATPEEIAGAVAYFASDDAAYTTGQIMDVSGGFGMPTPIFGDMIAMKSKRYIE